MLGAAQLIFLYNMVVSLEVGAEGAGRTPGGAKTIEWLVSSPPPRFNFDAIPRVVGGPYEFGVPGARHALLAGDEGYKPAPRARPVGAGKEPT